MYNTILIVIIGFSPAGASGTSLRVREYTQPSATVCAISAKQIIKTGDKLYGFSLTAICVPREKTNR